MTKLHQRLGGVFRFRSHLPIGLHYPGDHRDHGYPLRDCRTMSESRSDTWKMLPVSCVHDQGLMRNVAQVPGLR